MAKLAPHDLAQVLSHLPKQPNDERILVGFETADDAGVYLLNEDTALVHTVDFFTPVADDPFIYGQIAATNALNDIYAMGGKPLTALSIVCFPQKGEFPVLGEILRGGQKTMNDAGVSVIGGHSVDDAEIKIGYAVTGVVDPHRIIKNAGARPGDKIVLTKPLGTGAICTAIKHGKASRESMEAALSNMTKTAARAAEAMQRVGAHACTDITGFGLIGHAYEMAKASDVTLQIVSASVPLLPDVLELIRAGMLTRGDKNNRAYVGDQLSFDGNVSKEMQSALLDPQTAGGLLISVDSAQAEQLCKEADGTVIGDVKPKGTHLLMIN